MIMADIQQALYGGNISGRRLRGVKINPIYQENDPGSRDGQPGDTQSESALPIGEIQIEVYESLPRNCQRSFLPSGHSSSEPCDAQDGCSPMPSCSSVHGSDGDETGKRGSCSEQGGCSVGQDVMKKCPGVKGIMGVDSLPWSFLQGRSPARREPVWGAFRNLENKTLPGLREDNEDRSEAKVHKRPLESSSSLSSESRNALASFEDLGINSETDSDVGVSILETSGEGEPPGDCSPSSEQHGRKNRSGEKSQAIHPSEYQAYFVTVNNHPNLASVLAQGPFHYGTLDAYSKQMEEKNEYSHFAHIGKLYSTDGNGLENKLSHMSHDVLGKNGLSVQHPTNGGNGLKMNGMISPEDGHVLCTCPCHSQVRAQPPVKGMTGTILKDSSDFSAQKTSEKREDSKNLEDSSGIQSPETVLPGPDLNDSVKSSPECKTQEDGTTEQADVHDSSPKQHQENEPTLHKHSETCMMDFENNNNCLVLYSVNEDYLNPKGLVTVKPNVPVTPTPTSNNDSADDSKKECCPDSDEKDERVLSGEDANENKENVAPESDADRNPDKDVGSREELEKHATDKESSQTKRNVMGNGDEGILQSICKRCGCPKFPNSDATQYARMTALTSPGLTDALTQKAMTSPSLQASQGVHGQLPNDSILLRADDLNTQHCLQQYLAEAHRHYLRHLHTLNLPFDDAITTHTSPARSIPNHDPPLAFLTPCHHNTSDFIVPDTGELREDFSFNPDTVSYIDELGCCLPKNSAAKKSFKDSSTNSKSNSGQSSRNNSRQSSRNSRGGKHCSIEDLEAELQEEEEEGGNGGKRGSQAGSGNGSSGDLADQNAHLKKAGLSIIHIPGITCDPAFEMIVPYEEDEEESYSKRRRQRLKDMEDECGWKEPTSMKERLVKTAICVVLLCVFVGIFVGVAIHFANESSEDGPGSGSGGTGMISGSLYGM